MGKGKKAAKAVKAAIKGEEKVAKPSTLGKWVNFVKQHPYLSTGVVIAGGSRITGDNGFEFAGKGVKTVLNLNDDESVITQVGRSTVDFAVGEGEFDKTVHDAKNFVNGLKGGDGLSGGGDGQSQSMIGGLFSGITNGLKGVMSNIFGGVTNFLGSKSMPLTLLLPALWLMFGRFGWVGKVGGLLLGAFAASSLMSGNSQRVAQQVAPRQSAGSAQERFNEALKEQQMDDDDRYTVKR